MSIISQITLNSEPIDDDQVANESYVDSSSENDRRRQDFPAVFNDQDNESDNCKEN